MWRGQIDVTITYSLDNYITVQGKDKNGDPISDAGYLLGNVDYDETTKKVKYRGIEITNESLLTEYVGNNEYEYIKINGVKYYYNSGTDQWFTLSNGRIKLEAEDLDFQRNNNMGYLYYKEAAEFKNRLIDYGLGGLEASNAVDIYGQPLEPLVDENGATVYDFRSSGGKIFEWDGIEEPDSNFNNHRLAVIRYVVESNLTVALANYNNYGTGSYDFRMPKLAEEDWTKILNNVSLISFLQGLSIGGKIYNGYSVINNNKNEEVVTEDSIYIVEDRTVANSTYHRVTHTNLILKDNSIGVFNIDFEKKALRNANSTTTLYYSPQIALGCYTCYVAQTNVNDYDNIYDYLDIAGNQTLAKIYYTALGRERYSMYKVFRNKEEHVNQFRESS